MKYAATIIYVDDVSAALDFYGRAFGFTVDFDTGDYAVLSAEGTLIEIGEPVPGG